LYCICVWTAGTLYSSPIRKMCRNCKCLEIIKSIGMYNNYNIILIKFVGLYSGRLYALTRVVRMCVCVYKIWYWRLPSHRPGSRTHLIERGIGPSAISYHLSDGDGATHPSWIIFIKHWQPDRQPGSFRDNNNTYVAYSFFFLILSFFFFLINS